MCSMLPENLHSELILFVLSAIGLNTYWSKLQVREDIIKVMILREFQVDHLMFQLQNSSHGSIKNMTEYTTFLRVYNLVIGLFKLSEDLDILDIHSGQKLESCKSVLK